ncbi:helix-turn-helix domain-containing protein [Candidatus Uabimicrobium sp. HlEnr_7]|uniref:helix-turn-helix domain-containing protein n=1 Tax=Candidatus Uabimicrobium helgolandensis TaxID=3095367 RepID=UPI0035584A64
MSLKKVKSLREKMQITQKELAEKSEIAHATISRIESGKIKELKSEAVKRLAAALEVSVDFLLGYNKQLRRQRKESPQLNELVNSYEKLSFKGKEQLDNYIQFLVKKEQEQ